MDQHLWFGDLFAVVWVVFPFVPVVVPAPCVAVVFRQVRSHVPQRRLIVVEVVVKVEQTRINGAVGLQHGNIGELDVGRYIVFPNSLNHPISDQDMSVVDDIRFTGHGNNTPFEHVGSRVSVVVESIASNHVLSEGMRSPITPSRRGWRHFGDVAIGALEVGGVPPRIFARVG